jgi:hypothetical protein
MTSRCPWTGEPLTASAVAAHQKKFASSSARNEAHQAARKYAEHMIEAGFLTWATIREWHDRQKLSASSPCTGPSEQNAAGPLASAQP